MFSSVRRMHIIGSTVFPNERPKDNEVFALQGLKPSTARCRIGLLNCPQYWLPQGSQILAPMPLRDCSGSDILAAGTLSYRRSLFTRRRERRHEGRSYSTDFVVCTASWDAAQHASLTRRIVRYTVRSITWKYRLLTARYPLARPLPVTQPCCAWL